MRSSSAGAATTTGDLLRQLPSTDNHTTGLKPEIDLASPTFDALQYLAVTHGTTSFASLQNELADLKRSTSDKTEQLKALVSAHFDQYLSCHEAVRALADDIRTHQGESAQLLDSVQTLKRVTDSTLSLMLQRAKEQRRIRNTLSVLSRFRPVFEITTKMKESLANRNYEKLADDYCRLRNNSAKASISALQRVFTAAHDIANAANAELLKHFDDASLSVAEQKRAIAVLNALGFVEKPALVCLGKQFEFLERKLSSLSHEANPAAVVRECAFVIYRFRSGLWSFICETFKTPAGSTASAGSSGVTSAEAESIQHQAWSILSTSTQIMRENASPPTSEVLKQLNESFRQLNSLKKCPNASTLNANIVGLKDAFCTRFRAQIVLSFLEQVCEASRDQLMREYFDPVVAHTPSFATESSIDLTLGGDDQRAAHSLFVTSDASGLPLTKVAQLVAEATAVFDEIRNTSMVSSESKIELNRATVLTRCSVDVKRSWEAAWRQLGPALLNMLDSGDAPSAAGTPDGDAADASELRNAVVDAFKKHLHDMLALFLEKLLRSFVTEISPPTTMASVTGSARSRSGAGACVLFAVVSNCIEIRTRCVASASKWVSQLQSSSSSVASGKGDNVSELRQLVQETEAKCVDMYVSMHTGPLLQVLKAGAAEEAQQSRLTSGLGSSASSRTASRSDSRTSSFIGASDVALPIPSTPTAATISAAVASSNVPSDGRQYVFNVLLQLITLRSEIETSLAKYAQCPEYVRAVTFQLTRVLGAFLEDAVRELETSGDATEWRRIHLLVETRFFLFALSDLMAEQTKIQLIALEKALQQAKASEKAALAQVALLSQMKHQTKLYLLALALAALAGCAQADVDQWPSTENDHTKLQIVLPESLMKKDGYQHKDALFGYPAYAIGSLQTQLIYTNSTGCEKIAADNWEPPFALLLDRGGCHFVEKVRQAQHAGARAVLIADSKCLCTDTECLASTGDDFCETVLPFMADDESGGDISIPSMLIRKSDGDAIKKAIAHSKGVSNVMVKFDWGIPSPDGRVEWTLWQSAWDDQSLATLAQLEEMVTALGSRAFFTPRFVSYNGSKVGCHADDGDFEQACGNMCLNKGRYCLLDPSPFHDRDSGASGADVVIENLRRKCIWRLVTKDEPGVGLKWWQYVKASGAECGQDENVFKERHCAEKIMRRLQIDVHEVETCMHPYGIDVDAKNPMLEEELKEQTALQLLRLPALYVDGVHARGRVDPTSILGMICAGYGVHDPPAICTCANQAPMGLLECVKVGGMSNAALLGGGGYSFGSVLVIMLFVAGAVSAAGFVYWRRTQRHMREQVRSILAEYMPLEDQGLLDDVDDDEYDGHRMHPAAVAAAKSPRGYMPTRGFLDEAEDGV